MGTSAARRPRGARTCPVSPHPRPPPPPAAAVPPSPALMAQWGLRLLGAFVGLASVLFLSAWTPMYWQAAVYLLAVFVPAKAPSSRSPHCAMSAGLGGTAAARG